MRWDLGKRETSDESGEPSIYIVRRFLGPHHNDEVNVGLSVWNKRGGFFGARPKRITRHALCQLTGCLCQPRPGYHNFCIREEGQICGLLRMGTDQRHPCHSHKTRWTSDTAPNKDALT